MINNRIDEVMKEQGRKPQWVCDQYNELTGDDVKKLNPVILWNIRTNRQEIKLVEAVFLAEVFGIKDYTDLIIKV